MHMDRQQKFFDFDDENFMYVIMLVFLQLRHQEETDKMLRELDKELRLSNRFFPDGKLIDTIQSLSAISSLKIKRGTKLFRCRLISKEQETSFLKPLMDDLISLTKKFVPTFDENAAIAGMTEWVKLPAYFSQHQDELCKWEEASQLIEEHYSKSSFWGYDKDGSDAPPPGCPAPGRINPDGISYLYAAEDIRTAILEVRPIPTQYVSVAQIEIVEDINIYSFVKPMEMDSEGKNWLSCVDYDEISKYFAAPNYGGKSYYLATQYISEYIKHMKNSDGQAMFDGLCFRSSLNPDGTNCVLFDVSPTRKYQICNSSLCQVKNLLGDFEYILPMSTSKSEE